MGVWRGRSRLFKNIRKRRFMMSGWEIIDGYDTMLVYHSFFPSKCWQYPNILAVYNTPKQRSRKKHMCTYNRDCKVGLYIITENKEEGRSTCTPTTEIAKGTA
ncbi:hypothetical protein MKW98_010619 [Papaver atlanticum]|uniref:Uncharacterized protein n=1 Tax=Papaver atlanticum TaxID=357466 RepID=A0AAD4S2M1_9MAGN|nr:hypothetical protein MKW98_010619 [Papaver atlanticum]